MAGFYNEQGELVQILEILQNGSVVATDVGAINFTGDGVTVTDNGDGSVTVNIPATPGSVTFVDNEVVAGSVSTFTLANTPIVGSVHVYANGQRLTPTVDYTISGATITTVLVWDAGTVLADYRTV